MKIRYEPALLDELVLQRLALDEREGNRRAGFWYRLQAEQIYSTVPPEDREQAFAVLHERLIHRWGYERLLRRSLSRFRRLRRRVATLWVLSAANPSEEGADLVGTPPALRATLRTRPARWSEPERLQPWLRHELAHLEDMLDPRFGYARVARLSPDVPALENLVRERLGVLWDVYIDGRLARSAGEPQLREQCLRRFQAAFDPCLGDRATAAFERLWDADRITYDELLAMARDPTVLERWVGFPANDRRAPLTAARPGAPCPACGFPTHTWAPAAALNEAGVRARVRVDLPTWEPEWGLCERCLEHYRAQAAPVEAAGRGLIYGRRDA